MYFPYLRGRQFELIAIRDLAVEGALEKITPIIEPVKESFNSLDIANKVLFESGITPFLIMNPQVGELSGDFEYYLKYVKELENSMYRCAFHYTDNSDYILKCLDDYNLDDCMIIGLDGFNDEEQFIKLCNDERINYIALLEPHRYRTLDRNIKKINKVYVRLDDLFEKQQRNSDFLHISKHKFSEEHLYYKEDNYRGFGDFTILPREYIEGGSTPRAVVINITYINDEVEDQIWIRHFTSDTNDTIANVQGKFAEATRKAIDFCNELPLQNSGVDELREYFKDSKYPGLGTVKKITIKNHLLVIKSYLDR